MHEKINEVRKRDGKRSLDFKETKTEYKSKTDPECGMFHKAEKERQLTYSTQVACDEVGWVTNAKVYLEIMYDNSGIDFSYPLIPIN
ncbi:MAG: hypothetical protein K2N64_04295 [Anaeroplasmataceae bacterium]|nr:hypothetical protein [Anaeroplasmataceae bacterium]